MVIFHSIVLKWIFFPQGGKFNIVPLLVNVGSGLALLGIVSWLGCFCIELIALDHASFDHKWFVNMMEVLTRQFRIFVCDYLGICCKITIAKVILWIIPLLRGTVREHPKLRSGIGFYLVDMLTESQTCSSIPHLTFNDFEERFEWMVVTSVDQAQCGF